MSVYSITVAERDHFMTERYMVEAETMDDACKLAIGAHALEEQQPPDKFEIVAVQKSSVRHVLTAEIVPAIPV